VQLGHGGRQVQRGQDLLGDVPVFDERDEAQQAKPCLALLTDDLEPEGSAEKLGPRDVLGLARRLLQLLRGGGFRLGLGHDLAAEAAVRREYAAVAREVPAWTF
jgi:hypothetical protein